MNKFVESSLVPFPISTIGRLPKIKDRWKVVYVSLWACVVKLLLLLLLLVSVWLQIRVCFVWLESIGSIFFYYMNVSSCSMELCYVFRNSERYAFPAFIQAKCILLALNLLLVITMWKLKMSTGTASMTWTNTNHKLQFSLLCIIEKIYWQLNNPRTMWEFMSQI